MTEGTSDVDLTAAGGSIDAAVRRRRAAGGYSPALLAAVEQPLDGESRDDLVAAANLDVERAPESARRLFGPVAVSAKRTVRRLIAWYVRPIATHQTAFNLAAARRIARIEERISQLGPVWARPAGSPPAEAGLDGIVALRAHAVIDACEHAPPGPVLIGGPGAPALVRMLDGVERQVITAEAPLDALEADDRAPFAVVVLAGVLPLLGGFDVLRVLPLARARLQPGGVVVADTPVATSTAADAEGDPAHVRRLSPSGVSALVEAAGLRVRTLQTWDGLAQPWAVVQATLDA